MVGPFGLSPKATMGSRSVPLARALTARGHRVTVIMPPWHTPDEIPRTWMADGVEMRYVAVRPTVPALAYPTITRRLVHAALAWRPDVVHCFKPKAYAGTTAWMLWSRRKLVKNGAALVVDEDDWEGPGGWNTLEPYSTLLKSAFAWQERWGLTHCDAVTVASRALETLVWGLGAPPERVHYLPNGSIFPNSAVVGQLTSPTVLLYTRFYEFNPERAVSVFGRIHAARPDVRMLVVGRGLFARDDMAFDAAVSAHGLGDAVERAGWVDREALPALLQRATVALMPFDDTLVNRTKCSVKLADLQALGIPTVADDVGQAREYVRHGETGYLSPVGDVDAMAQAALRVIASPELAARLAEGARALSKGRFSWDSLVERAEAAYYYAVVAARGRTDSKRGVQ